MSSPITPLTPEQLTKQESQAAKEGAVHRDLVAVDIATNEIVLRGQMDETISSHAARADEEGKSWGKLVSRFLNLFQSDHGAKAQAGDLERAQNVARIEESSGFERNQTPGNASDQSAK
jgi:hypothetical protein